MNYHRLPRVLNEELADLDPGRRQRIAERIDREILEADGWISVHDKAPDSSEPVVYARPNGPGRWHVGIAYWTASKRWNPEAESTHASNGFTHYKPLGEPPKPGKY